jgi:hypothetical protein
MMGLDLPAALPSVAECRQWLQDLAATQVAELRQREESLRLGKDRADLEHVLKLALVLSDEDGSKHFLRYHGEWCSKFFRAFDRLPKVLQRDASGFFDELDDAAAEAEPATSAALAPSAAPGSAPGAAESAAQAETTADAPSRDLDDSTTCRAADVAAPAERATVEAGAGLDRPHVPDPPSADVVRDPVGSLDGAGAGLNGPHVPDPPSAGVAPASESKSTLRVTTSEPAARAAPCGDEGRAQPSSALSGSYERAEPHRRLNPGWAAPPPARGIRDGPPAASWEDAAAADRDGPRARAGFPRGDP